MALPSLPKKEPRPVPITIRLSKRAAEQLRTLARAHNMSQADVIEHMLGEEYKFFEKKRLRVAEKR